MKTIREWGEALRAREVSSEELTRGFLARVEEKEPEIGAFLTVTAEGALRAARSVDARRRAGEELPLLAGIPMALKDNLCTRGVRATCASRMLADFVPTYDATAVSRLSAAGAVMLGKLNMDEFAMGSSTENSAFHPTRNPADTARVPGGSSGGSAAAVAAGEAVYALGSDTGGSIRQPAAFCGVVGLKPTYGRVSRYGLVAFASSLDQVGPITSCVADNAAVLSAVAGQDPRDATSAPRPAEDFSRWIGRGVRDFRVALPREFFGEGLDAEVKAAVLASARQLEAAGAVVEEVSLPSLSAALPAYYVLSSAEASSNLARFDGVRFGSRAAKFESIGELYCRTRTEFFGEEVKRRILLGTFALSAGYYDAYYKKALQMRTRIAAEYEKIFASHDLILSPVAPTTAYRLGEKTADPMQMYLGDIYTVPVNIAGIPALSLPCGRDAAGLPIGVQLMGPKWSEARLYQAAAVLEEGSAYHEKD